MALFGEFDKLLAVFVIVVLGIFFAAAVNVDPSRPFHSFSQIAVGSERVVSDSNSLLAKFGGTGIASCQDGNVLKWVGDASTGGWACGGVSFTATGLPPCLAGQVLKFDGALWACGDDLNSGVGVSLPVCINDQVLKWNGAGWSCGSDNVGSGGAWPVCSNGQVLKYDSGTSAWICANDSTSGGGGANSTKGIYVGWGQDKCANGFNELYSGWMYQGGQDNGNGGDIVCSKTKQGMIYHYDGSNRSYEWDFAPPCVVCSSSSSVGQCYTNWGDKSCASGFDKQYEGKMLGLGQNGGEWKTSLVCEKTTIASKIYRFEDESGLEWVNSPDCSVCCNNSTGGTFTLWGQRGSSTTPSCPAGYSSLYSGNAFQSGQRSGYGSNAVCGYSASAVNSYKNASANSVELFDGSYRWTNVPCSVCSKVTSAGSCFTLWGGPGPSLPGVPSIAGYTKIYTGSMLSVGANNGDGGGLVCFDSSNPANISGDGADLSTSNVYVYTGGNYSWNRYGCSVYCSNASGGQYTNWGGETCAGGFTKVNQGYLYQAGTNDGYGGEAVCSAGRQSPVYVAHDVPSPGSGVTYDWIDAPVCAQCVREPSNGAGSCYTSWGTQSCSSGYSPVVKGFMFSGSNNGGYGQANVCSDNIFLSRQYQYNWDRATGYDWHPARPCATCCKEN